MAQDNTYTTKIYHDRDEDLDEDRLVAARDGTFAVESGGSVLVYSGAQMIIESGANFELAGADMAADDLRRLLVSEWGGVVTISASTGAVLGTKNLPKNARIVNIVGAVSCSQCSFWLTSVSAGREVFLRVIGDKTGTWTYNNTSVEIYTSGCIILGSIGAPVASMHMQTSATHDTGIWFKAIADNVWAVISELGTISES